MPIRSYFLVFLLAFCPARTLGDLPPAHWLVVTAPAFRSIVEPLCELRRAQGMEVVVLETTDILTEREILSGDAHKLRNRVNQLCRQANGPCYVLLVGAIEADTDKKPDTVLPPLTGTMGRMKGQVTDNGYGCPGKDLLATVAVGRFPARTREEARHMVEKTLAYEHPLPGRWRRQITVLAGVPAFNPFVDKLVESLALARFDRIDPSWTGRAIYHNSQSRFCVPDDRLHDLALDYVQGGQAFTLYLGHSGPQAFWAEDARFLDRDDWAHLTIAKGPGVFATFGCLGCQLKGDGGEGYGVAAIRNPGGPAAVLGSQGICFAAMVQLAADGLFESNFSGTTSERLGDVWLGVKAGLARGRIDALTFKLLDAVDGDSTIPQAVQRQEHQEMFVLLGDPAMRLPTIPSDLKLTGPGAVAPGRSIVIKGKVSPRLAGARIHLVLERPPSSQPAQLEILPAGPPAERIRVMMANHQQANNFELAEGEGIVKNGTFEGKLPVPENLPWRRVLVRAYGETNGAEGLGFLVLPVKMPPP